MKGNVLPVVLYGCEMWFLTLMEERDFQMYGNKVRALVNTVMNLRVP
jgi:hypothetical protein